MIKGKKGMVDGTSQGDAGVSTATTLSFIKLILILILATLILLFYASKFINSKAPIPTDLESDLQIARLTNVCLAITHDPFDIKDQQMIYENSLTKEKVNNCFTKLGNTKIKKINLQWITSSGLKTKTIEVSKEKFTDLNLLYVLVVHDDGTKTPGTLSVYK